MDDDRTLCVGIDVGSTTVKAVVVDPVARKILWKDYQRHEIVRLLLTAGADVNCEYNGRSLLANVERLGRQDLVRVLLEHGAKKELAAPLHAEVAASPVPVGATARNWPERAL